MRFSSRAMALSLLAFGSTALADEYIPGVALVNPALSGATSYDGWISLTAPNYPGYGGFPGMGPWPAPIGSNRTLGNTFNKDEPGDAGLLKIANGAGGGPYPASLGLYFGGFSGDINNDGGTLEVSDATPVPGVKNVIFQVQIGEAWTYDFHDDVFPTLSFNGGAQQLEADAVVLVERFPNGTVTMPSGEEEVFINTYLLQWDLSAIDEPVTALAVSFTGVQHGQLYGLRLDQSDVFTPVGGEPCVVDLNGDGVVDFADYLEFLNRFDAQDPSVDFNQDGLVDFADYLEFLNLFDTGC